MVKLCLYREDHSQVNCLDTKSPISNSLTTRDRESLLVLVFNCCHCSYKTCTTIRQTTSQMKPCTEIITPGATKQACKPSCALKFKCHLTQKDFCYTLCSEHQLSYSCIIRKPSAVQSLSSNHHHHYSISKTLNSWFSLLTQVTWTGSLWHSQEMQVTTFTFYVYSKQTLTTKKTGLLCLPQCSCHSIFSTKTCFGCVLAFPGFLLVYLGLFVLGFCLGFALCVCVFGFVCLFAFRKFDWNFLLLIVLGFSLGFF